MNIEEIELEKLLNDPKNLRTHDERNLGAIQASLSRFGQQKPIVVDADNVVIAGNGTLAGAKALGWKTIKIHRTSLRGIEAMCYAIADNRTAELADWDREALTQTLFNLRKQDKKLVTSSGFSEDEINQLSLGFVSQTQEHQSDSEFGEGEKPAVPVMSLANQVRMVQLFLTHESYPEFESFCKTLKPVYQTENFTDTVFACLKANANLVESLKEKQESKK